MIKEQVKQNKVKAQDAVNTLWAQAEKNGTTGNLKKSRTFKWLLRRTTKKG